MVARVTQAGRCPAADRQPVAPDINLRNIVASTERDCMARGCLYIHRAILRFEVGGDEKEELWACQLGDIATTIPSLFLITRQYSTEELPP